MISPVNLSLNHPAPYPWIYYSKLIDPNLAESLYQQVEPLSVHKTGTYHGKSYTVGRKSCFFTEDQSNKKTSGYGRYTPHHITDSPTLFKIKQQMEKFTQLRFPYALVHIYRTGKDKIPWHRDNEALDPDTSIISISLGATRKFRFREIGKTSGWTAEYSLESGDMVWMLPGCQRKYMHTVPVESKVKDWRINITLREEI